MAISSVKARPDSLLARLRARCGEFWWWSALIFFAYRIGDAINAFTGLWLVPRYIGADELGAALPLTQVGALFGIPVSILVIPFSRWLTLYAAHGEKGKVKRLLSIVLTGAAIAFVATMFTARFLLPHIFERLRVAEGSLGMLIICVGLIGPTATTFNYALQGLKRFGVISLVNALSAPLRLLTMVVAIPFRALSGYMLGQIAPPALTIAASAVALRRELGRDVKSQPLGRADVSAMIRYTAPIAVHVIIATIFGTWQMLLFRQRLPEIESAAFYMISRLAEIAAYAGMSLSVVVFPLAAEAGEKGGGGSAVLLRRLMLGTFLPGAALTIAMFFFSGPLMRLVPSWTAYEAYGHFLPLQAAKVTFSAVVTAFATCEVATAHFRFLWYWVPFTIVETGVLVALTGYGAFRGILPDAAVDWMQSLNAASLEFFVWWLAASSFVQSVAVAVHIWCKKCASRRKNACGSCTDGENLV